MAYTHMILLAVTIAVVGLIYMIYFYAPADVTPNADQLATNAKSNRVFHELLANDSTLRAGFPADGLVLCFEKISRDRMRRRNGETVDYSPTDQCRLFDIDPALAVLTKHGLAESARKLAISTLNDPKPLMLTHWFEKANGNVHTRYNVYASLETENYDLPPKPLRSTDRSLRWCAMRSRQVCTRISLSPARAGTTSRLRR